MSVVRSLRGLAMPGALTLRLMLMVALSIALAGALTGWLTTRAAAAGAIQRVLRQQGDEVQTLSRVLASKFEQSQKVLRAVAAGVTPEMLEARSPLDWLLQQGLPAGQFFDALVVLRADGSVRANLRYGAREDSAGLDADEREVLQRTLADGKPQVSELVGGSAGQPRVLFTQPLRAADGSVSGVVAGALRLQSQGLLPASISPPERSGSRLVVFARNGTILSHPDPSRVLGQVRDEPGLSDLAAVQRSDVAATPIDDTLVVPGYVISMASMPLPQWTVARISTEKGLIAPLAVTQQLAWWLAAAVVVLIALMGAGLVLWQLQSLARLRDRSMQLAMQPQFEDSLTPPPVLTEETGVLGQVLDMFEQERNGYALRDQALMGRLQAILDHAPVGIVITRGSRLRMFSRQAAQILGYSTEELLGRSVRDLYSSEAAYSEWKARAGAAFASHGAFDGDVCFTRKDGSPVWVRVQGRITERPGSAPGTVWILEELTAAHEALRQGGTVRAHDTLTGLMDRRAFDERLQGVLQGRKASSAANDALCGVVMCVDLDHFTSVNDTAGHAAGDDVLTHVARLLEVQIRQAGWIARPGGDEFFVVLPNCSAAHGMAVAEKMRAAVQAWTPHYAERHLTLRVSIGVVALTAFHPDATSVLRAADMACYRAKREGRNRVVLHVDRVPPYQPQQAQPA